MRIYARTFLLCFSVCLMLHPMLAAAQQPEAQQTLAVLPLAATGVSPPEANALTNQLQNELVQTSAVTVIERARVDELLQEQGLGQTGCITNECVAEAGRLLGAQLMVAGSVDKLGQTYNVVARIVDVETGRVTVSNNITHRGEIDGLLDRMRDLARALVSISEPPPPPAEFQLRVNPTPNDASVIIDGQERGRGSVTATLTAGAHTVRVVREGHNAWEQTIQLTQNQTLTARLTRIRYQLRITAPADATVYIDGRRAGQGPVAQSLPAGAYEIRVERKNFQTWTRTVDLTEDDSVTAELQPVIRTPGGGKGWVWGLLGGLIAAGGGAAVAVMGGGGGTNGGNGGNGTTPVTGVSGAPPAPP